MDACYNPLINACYYRVQTIQSPTRPAVCARQSQRTAHTTLDGVLSLRFDD